MDRSNNPEAVGVFDNAPYLNFNDDKVKFNSNKVDNANDNYGSASLLLPKSLPRLEKRLANKRFSLFFGRPYPATEHSTDFINTFFKKSISF